MEFGKTHLRGKWRRVWERWH